MRLDRYDAAATAATAVAAAAYYGHLAGWGVLSGPRVTALAVLVTGLAACAVNGSRPGGVPTAGWYGRTASAFGIAAMVSGFAGVAFGIEAAVAVTAAITVLMWAVSTVRHLVAAPPAPPAPAAAVRRHRERVGV